MQVHHQNRITSLTPYLKPSLATLQRNLGKMQLFSAAHEVANEKFWHIDA